MDECQKCTAYDLGKQQCHRYPKVYEKGLSDWCMEFEAKEVIPDAVEERKIEESSVGEHPRIDALWPAAETGGRDSDEQGREVEEKEIKKRGWPKGKPRK